MKEGSEDCHSKKVEEEMLMEIILRRGFHSVERLGLYRGNELSLWLSICMSKIYRIQKKQVMNE